MTLFQNCIIPRRDMNPQARAEWVRTNIIENFRQRLEGLIIGFPMGYGDLNFTFFLSHAANDAYNDWLEQGYTTEDFINQFETMISEPFLDM